MPLHRVPKACTNCVKVGLALSVTSTVSLRTRTRLPGRVHIIEPLMPAVVCERLFSGNPGSSMEGMFFKL
eukprot:749944-Amphidinium_carterae.1